MTEPEKKPDTLESLAKEHLALCEKQIAELQAVLKQIKDRHGQIQNELAQMAAHRQRWATVLKQEHSRLSPVCESPFSHRSDCPCNISDGCTCLCGRYGTNNADPSMPVMDSAKE